MAKNKTKNGRFYSISEANTSSNEQNHNQTKTPTKSFRKQEEKKAPKQSTSPIGLR
jgi:hypothetical protein